MAQEFFFGRLENSDVPSFHFRQVGLAGEGDVIPCEIIPHTFRHTWLKRMKDDVSVPDLEIPLNVILYFAAHVPR